MASVIEMIKARKAGTTVPSSQSSKTPVIFHSAFWPSDKNPGDYPGFHSSAGYKFLMELTETDVARLKKVPANANRNYTSGIYLAPVIGADQNGQTLYDFDNAVLVEACEAGQYGDQARVAPGVMMDIRDPKEGISKSIACSISLKKLPPKNPSGLSSSDATPPDEEEVPI